MATTNKQARDRAVAAAKKARDHAIKKIDAEFERRLNAAAAMGRDMSAMIAAHDRAHEPAEAEYQRAVAAADAAYTAARGLAEDESAA